MLICYIYLATKGIFISTQLISIILAFILKQGKFNNLELYLFFLSIVCIILTSIVMLMLARVNIRQVLDTNLGKPDKTGKKRHVFYTYCL
jgi:hypothetical protein